MKNLIRRSLILSFALLCSVISFAQLGSSLNQAKNKNVNIDYSRPKFDQSGFIHEPLDLGPPNVNVTISEKTERSTYDDITLKIQRILWDEMPKYSNFYYNDQPPSVSTPKLTDDLVDEDGNQVVVGEYTYDNDYYNNSHIKVSTPKKSFIFRATIKKVFDKYTVNNIIYKQGNDWYRLFPENDVNTSKSNLDGTNGQESQNENNNTMVTNKEACLHITNEIFSDCILFIPMNTRVTLLQKQKVGEFYKVKYSDKVGYVYEYSLQ